MAATAAQPDPAPEPMSEARLDALLAHRRLEKLIQEVGCSNFAVIRHSEAIAVFSQQVTKLLATQVGEKVYQSSSFDVPLFPLAVAEQMFPDWARLPAAASAGTTSWRIETQQGLDEIVGPLLAGLPRPTGETQTSIQRHKRSGPRTPCVTKAVFEFDFERSVSHNRSLLKTTITI